MHRLVKRLGALERRRKRGAIIIAMQDLESPDIFNTAEQRYTGAELDALSASGVQVVRIVFVDKQIER